MSTKINPAAAPTFLAAILIVSASAFGSLTMETALKPNRQQSFIAEQLLVFDGNENLFVIRTDAYDNCASDMLRSVSTKMDLSKNVRSDRRITESELTLELIVSKLHRPVCIYGFGAIYDKRIFAGTYI